MFRNAVFLSDVCHGRNNNLNLIRMMAALAVLVSHAWPISLGHGTEQPLTRILHFNLGQLALVVFFGISGFLIARSFERQPRLRTWVLARVLRLFPALAVMLLLTVTLLGPVVTDLPAEDYATDPETHSYVLRNLLLAFRQDMLPGVFEHQPLPVETNGSLWTLRYEVLCYIGVMVMGLLGAFQRWRPLVAVASVLAVAYVVAFAVPSSVLPTWLGSFLSLAMPFAIGVGFYLARARLVLHPVILIGLVLATAAAIRTPLYQPMLDLAVCYGVFVLAYLPKIVISRYNAVGDYSYGLYIYAWPVQQSVIHFFGPMSPMSNIAIALPIALALAWASWTLVERPALKLVPHSEPLPQEDRDGASPLRNR